MVSLASEPVRWATNIIQRATSFSWGQNQRQKFICYHFSWWSGWLQDMEEDDVAGRNIEKEPCAAKW